MGSKSYALDLDAAREEGMIPMPEDLVPLRDEKLLIDQEMEKLEARLAELKATFKERLEAENAIGFILNDKIHARRKLGDRTSVDSPKLRKEMPHIFAKYSKTVSVTSIVIN